MHSPGDQSMNASYAARVDAARPCNGWPADDWKIPDTSCLPMTCVGTPAGALHRELPRRLTTWLFFRHLQRNRATALPWFCLAPTWCETRFWPSGCKTALRNFSSSVTPQTILPPRHSRPARPPARPPGERPRFDRLTFNLRQTPFHQTPFQLTSLQLYRRPYP